MKLPQVDRHSLFGGKKVEGGWPVPGLVGLGFLCGPSLCSWYWFGQVPDARKYRPGRSPLAEPVIDTEQVPPQRERITVLKGRLGHHHQLDPGNGLAGS
jgi:hypothetical protein